MISTGVIKKEGDPNMQKYIGFVLSVKYKNVILRKMRFFWQLRELFIASLSFYSVYNLWMSPKSDKNGIQIILLLTTDS